MSSEISSSSPNIASTKDDNNNIIDHKNEETIKKLYKALSEGDMAQMASLIATDEDLDYWFHGPPNCQHMMRLLTGSGPVGPVAFRFEPRSVTAVGGTCVIAEGWEGAKAYWVHVWTLGPTGGVLTALREYFNTWLTVRDLRPGWDHRRGRHVATLLWRSMPRDLFPRSLPGLLLAI